jgi:hypothetical protein
MEFRSVRIITTVGPICIGRFAAKLFVRHQAGKQDATRTIDAKVLRTKTDLLAVTA